MLPSLVGWEVLLLNLPTTMGIIMLQFIVLGFLTGLLSREHPKNFTTSVVLTCREL